MSRKELIGWTSSLVLIATVLCIASLGYAQPASQPANLADPGWLVTLVLGAFGNKSWPVVLMGSLSLFLIFERRYPGLFGEKSSAFLGSRRGAKLMALAQSVVTAGLSAATGGWGALGKGCAIALLLGLFNYVANAPTTKG